jgi:hypothetical protein
MPPAAVALTIAAVVSLALTVWVTRPARPRLRVERVAPGETDAAALATLPPNLRAVLTRLIAAHASLDEASREGSRLPALATEVVSAAIPLVIEAARLEEQLERHDLARLEDEARSNPVRRPLLDDVKRMQERHEVIVAELNAVSAQIEDRATLNEDALEAAGHRLRLL